MSNYIDEDYYYDTYEGNLIPQKNIEKYATKASNEVRKRIFNKNISSYEEEVKNVTCLVADILYNQFLIEEETKKLILDENRKIVSEKVGDYSVNYSSVSLAELKNISSQESVDKKIDKEIETNLFHTGLLYSGICDVR